MADPNRIKVLPILTSTRVENHSLAAALGFRICSV